MVSNLRNSVTLLLLILLVGSPELRAEITVPSADGSDGEFSPTENIEIDLSLAANATWNIPSSDPGKGVYDAEKWAVVYKYSSVTIPAGVKVTFKNHPANGPVVWLVNGDVTIDGTIDVSTNSSNLLEPGPGGFHGGLKSAAQLSSGPGIGPGAGKGISGSYSTGTRTYGNAQIVPLIGGSGGSSGTSFNGTPVDGQGGGGAILIAASNEINITGSILANSSGNGSGGAVRLIADKLNGTGIIRALGSGQGRIRLEAITFSNSLNVNPFTKVVSPENPILLWPRNTDPTARIVSINNELSPSDPRFANAYGTGDSDVKIDTVDPVDVVIETTNVKSTGTVQLFLKPIRGQDSILDATHDSGDETISTWIVSSVDLPKGSYVMQVRAVTD